MPVFRQTWQFFGATSGRWSEVMYLQAANIGAAAIINPALLDARIKLLHPVNMLQTIRVASNDNNRVTVPVRINSIGLDPAAISPAGDIIGRPANAAEAAVISMVATLGGARRYLWMRGISETSVQRRIDGETEWLPAFRTRIKTWLGALQASSYIILKRTPKTVGDPFDYRITAVNPSNASGRCVLKMTGVYPGLTAGSWITLQRFDQKQFPGLSGKFLLLKVNADEITVQYVTPTDAINIPTNGTWRPLTYIDNAIISRDNSDVAYLGRRDTRNFTGNSRGARSARRIRNLA